MKHKKKELKFFSFRKYLWFIGIVFALILLVNILSRLNVGFANDFSTRIFPSLVKTVGAFFGLVPFSVIEILIWLTAAVFIYCLVKLIVLLIIHHSKRERFIFFYKLKRYSMNLVCIILVCILIVSVNCGIHYNRLPFATCANIKSTEHTEEKLLNLLALLVEDANSLSAEIPTDENGVFTTDRLNLPEESVNAMYSLEAEYPFMTDYYPMPKSIILSKGMSYTGTAGFYSPFTLEANYNSDITDLELPYTICHELAHISGFIHEDEANFIAYLACIRSDRPEFRYSGTVNVLIYVANAAYNNCDGIRYKEIISKLNPQVSKDLADQSQYWRQFESPVMDTSETLNDTYLNVQGESEGVLRYDMVTELLMDYYSNII